MTNPDKMAQLRRLLSLAGSSDRWWDAVELCLSAGEASDLYVQTLLHHASNASAWKGCRVPKGDWPAEHPGHELCEVLQRSLTRFPEAVEIHCPPGTFVMGAREEDEDAAGDEGPSRNVTLTEGFWALSTPVTKDMYYEVTGAREYERAVANEPVEHVSWWDAVRFCNQLSALEGLPAAYELGDMTGSEPDSRGEHSFRWRRASKGYRLPTEAEWEYACRAGSTAATYGVLDEISWTFENSTRACAGVGKKRANAWGLHDTLGNVWEWCVDEFRLFDSKPEVDPAFVPATVRERVQRGCYVDDYLSVPQPARAFRRNSDWATEAYELLGFRVVRTAS